jgi:hypothetical protein
MAPVFFVPDCCLRSRSSAARWMARSLSARACAWRAKDRRLGFRVVRGSLGMKPSLLPRLGVTTRLDGQGRNAANPGRVPSPQSPGAPPTDQFVYDGYGRIGRVFGNAKNLPGAELGSFVASITQARGLT